MTDHERATPRPWYWEPGSSILKTRIGSEGHRRGVGDFAFIVMDDTGRTADQGDPEADAALIVEAVNSYDWLRRRVERDAQVRDVMVDAIRILEHTSDRHATNARLTLLAALEIPDVPPDPSLALSEPSS